jgi:hypothetical protein
MNGGKAWKTLDEVDVVVIATVDQKDDPQKVAVHIFDRDEVRTRFAAAYKARVKAGILPKDDFGMWINGDPDDRGIPGSVGAGLFAVRPPIAIYNVQELLKPQASDASVEISAGPIESAPPASSLGGTIADVLKAARERIAQLAGGPIESVRLDLKLEM